MYPSSALPLAPRSTPVYSCTAKHVGRTSRVAGGSRIFSFLHRPPCVRCAVRPTGPSLPAPDDGRAPLSHHGSVSPGARGGPTRHAGSRAWPVRRSHPTQIRLSSVEAVCRMCRAHLPKPVRSVRLAAAQELAAGLQLRLPVACSLRGALLPGVRQAARRLRDPAFEKLTPRVLP